VRREGYHSVTLKPETFSILEGLSKNLGQKIPDTIHSIVTGKKFVFGILYRPEYVCVTCSRVIDYCADRTVDKCPFCNGPVNMRYVKVETRES